MNDFPYIPLDVISRRDATLAYNGGEPSIQKESRKTQYPLITKEDGFQLLKAVKSDERETGEVEKLTFEYQKYVGSKYALATSSGTSSLHIALSSIGIEPGDEIIVPAFTFIATAMAVLHVKAIPIFADIDIKTFCLDPSQVEALITPRTKAIMPVHVHGLPANIPVLKDIAERYNLMIIEDASHAHSAKINDTVCGALGDAAGQSLMADKNFFVGGEGGMAFFSREDFYEHALKYIKDNGLQYEMSWMVASIGRSQLKRLRYYDAVRARNARLLGQRLRDIGGFKPPFVPEGYTHSYNMYRITIDPVGLGLEDIQVGRLKEAVRILILCEGVPAREWQNVPIPLHRHFRNCQGWGRKYPWSLSNRKEFGYGIENFPNVLKMLESTLVLCREMRSPVEVERIERYAYALEKIKKNKDVLAKLAKEIDFVPCYEQDTRLG